MGAEKQTGAAMRLLLTSYPKSGTHQIYPMFQPSMINIEDRSSMNLKGTDKFGFPYPSADFPLPGHKKTYSDIVAFKGKAFGHLAYLPEFAQACQTTPTKVIFNVRDPRDIIISELENMRSKKSVGKIGLWDTFLEAEGKYLSDTDDPIALLIKFASARWPNWLGWLDHPSVEICHYEDLRSYTDQAVAKLCRVVDPGLLGHDKEWMVKRAQSKKSATFRKGLIGEHRRYFTGIHWALCDQYLSSIMARLGYNREGRIWSETEQWLKA
jgi:hypothetical protein